MAKLTVPEPSLVVMVGPAGSGKSTLASRLFAADEILSSDALRAAVSGDEADQSASRTAFSMLHRALARRLAAGELTVVDATNLRREHRRPLVDRARQAGLPAVAIVLDLPADVVRARNAGRTRVVPSDVIDRHLSWLRRTVDGDQLAAEGFASVIVLQTPDDVAGFSISRVPSRPAPLSPAP